MYTDDEQIADTLLADQDVATVILLRQLDGNLRSVWSDGTQLKIKLVEKQYNDTTTATHQPRMSICNSNGDALISETLFCPASFGAQLDLLIPLFRVSIDWCGYDIRAYCNEGRGVWCRNAESLHEIVCRAILTACL